MNYIYVTKLEDLDQLLAIDIYLTGSIKDQEAELRYNTWEISFDHQCIQQLTLLGLTKFISTLIQRRSEQVKELNRCKYATFYMWFDTMSFQLCFDILSGKNITLPFGCTIRKVESLEEILKKFLAESKQAAHRGSHIPFEDITFIERNDEDFGKIDEFDPKSFIQEVYVTIL